VDGPLRHAGQERACGGGISVVRAINPGVGWDASRPVPWLRLAKEYLIYAAIMAVILFVLFRDDGVLPLLAGLVAAGPIYLLLGYVLAKFGYQRKTLADLRTPRAARSATSTASTATAGDTPARSRPAPTRRTAAGSNRRPATTRKRRR